MKGSSRRAKPSVALNVLAVIVAINVAGAAVYTLTRNRAQQQARALAAGGGATPDGEPTSDVSRALRAAGLAALESGRYEEAVKYFTEAAKSSKASTDLPQLMKIAMELRDRSAATPQTRSATPTDSLETPEAKPTEVAEVREDEKPTPATVTDSRSRDAKRREKEREREREREREAKERARRAALAATRSNSAKPETVESEPPVPAAQPGTIIVSSTPSGLMVQLDGRSMDVTPLRLTVEPGPHEITLLHNSTVVFSRRMNVVSTSVLSIDPDVSAQVALLTQPTKPTPAEPVATVTPNPTSTATSGLQTPPPADKPGEPNVGKPESGTKPVVANLDADALYVVAHPSLGLSSISSDQLADIYFGRSSTINGRRVEPILRAPSAGAGAAFFKRVLHANTRQYRESWQKLELAGKATPPPILNNASDVWRAVSSRGGAISFALGAELSSGATSLKPVRISN